MGRQTAHDDREGSLLQESRKGSPTERGRRNEQSKGPSERPGIKRKENHKAKAESKEHNHISQAKKCSRRNRTMSEASQEGNKESSEQESYMAEKNLQDKQETK